MCSYTLADGLKELSVKLAISAMLKALRERKFVSINLLLDGEGAIALCIDIMRSLGVKFNPAGPDQQVPTVERDIRDIKSKVRGF